MNTTFEDRSHRLTLDADLSSRLAETPTHETEFRFGPEVILIRPHGPSIDSRDAAAIVGLVREELEDRRRPVRKLLLDLEAVVSPSSIAIGMLLELDRLARGVGATVELAVDSRFREVLQMLRLDSRYTMVRNGRRLSNLVR